MNAHQPGLASRHAPSSGARAWLMVGLLTVLMVINFADKLAFGLAAKPIIKEFHLSLSTYGMLSSAFFFLFFVTAVLGGFAGNRLRTKWLILAIALIWALAQLSLVAASGVAMILVSRVLLGAAEGPTYPLINHASFKWLRNSDRSLGSALLTAGGSLGVLIGAPVLTYMIVQHGWRSAFVLTAVVGLVWCALWLALGKESPSLSPEPAADRDAGIGERGLQVSYRRIFTSGTFLAASFAAFAAYWSVALGLTFGPLYLQDVLGLSRRDTSNVIVAKEAAAIVVVYAGIGYLIKRLLASGVPSRYARGVIGGLCLLLSGAALVLMVEVPGVGVKLGFWMVAALAVVMFPIGATVCAEIAPPGQRAGVLGAYSALYALSGVIAPAVTGRLTSGRHGEVAGLHSSWLLMGGLLVVAAAAAIAFIRPERDAHLLRTTTKPPKTPLESPPPAVAGVSRRV